MFFISVFLWGCQTTKGEACKFPFTYQGTEYNQCTTVANNGVPWCSTATGWGNCQQSCTSSLTTGGWDFFESDTYRNISGCLTLTTTGEACTFPFTYKGNVYYGCTSVANNGVPWCSTATGWGTCDKSCDGEINSAFLLFDL